MKQVLMLLAGAAMCAASPFQYNFTAPAISTGIVTGNSFSLFVTVPNLLTGSLTNITSNPTLTISNLIDPAYPNLTSVVASSTVFRLSYSAPGGGTLLGVLSPAAMTQPGTYSALWNLIRTLPGRDTGVVGDFANTQITVTDLGQVPEPSTWMTMLGGLGIVTARVRRTRGRS